MDRRSRNSLTYADEFPTTKPLGTDRMPEPHFTKEELVFTDEEQAQMETFLRRRSFHTVDFT